MFLIPQITNRRFDVHANFLYNVTVILVLQDLGQFGCIIQKSLHPIPVDGCALDCRIFSFGHRPWYVFTNRLWRCIQLLTAEVTTEHQTTYGLPRDNKELDKTTRTTDPDIYNNLDKDSRTSSSTLLTPHSRQISVCELFNDHEPAPILPLEGPGQDDMVDSLSHKSSSGSDSGKDPDEVVDCAKRPVHSKSDSFLPKCHPHWPGPREMIITRHGNESINISNIEQGNEAVFFVGPCISNDLMEALYLDRSSWDWSNKDKFATFVTMMA